MKNIAVLLTCFNRREKTLSCLNTFFNVLDSYNADANEDGKINASVFLTDDGCTDGTSEAVEKAFADRDLFIVKGTGSLYWSGGMCMAWEAAIKERRDWDFFLLLNDDVDLLGNLFDELFDTHKYSLATYGKGGIYSGITSAKSDFEKMTYGGNVWVNRFLGMSRRLQPTGVPQLCDTTNANILLVTKEVVDAIGIFWNGYEHGCSDYDYSSMARRAGFPVLITANFCGRCDDDHKSSEEIKSYILNAPLKERRKYFNHPVHSNKDYLTYIRRNIPFRYPFVYLGRFFNLYFPKFYYWLSQTVRKK